MTDEDSDRKPVDANQVSAPQFNDEIIVNQSGFAIALREVLNEKIDQSNVYELRYGQQTLVLLNEEGQVIARVSDPRLISAVEFPSFFSSQKFLVIPFETGQRAFVGEQSELDALRRQFEVELFAAQPELIESRRRNAINELLIGLVISVIGIGGILLTMMQDMVVKLLYVLTAVGLGLVGKAISNFWSLHVLRKRLQEQRQFGDGGSASTLPISQLPGSVARLAREGQHSAQLVGILHVIASFAAGFSVLAAGYGMVKYEAKWKLGVRAPVPPHQVAPVPALDLGVPLPKGLDETRFLSPSEPVIELTLGEVFVLGGLWDAEQPRLEIKGMTIFGEPVGHTPFVEMLGRNPTGQSRSRVAAKFELPSLEGLHHQETHVTAAMPILKAIHRGPQRVELAEETLRAKAVIFVVANEELPKIREHQGQLLKWKEFRQRADQYNSAVPSYNDAVAQTIERNQSLTIRRRTWLFGAMAVAIVATLLSLTSRRFGRTLFHAICLGAIGWMLWIDLHAQQPAITVLDLI